MNKRSWKTTAVFSGLVFTIITVTMLISFLIILALYSIGILDRQHWAVPIIVFAVVSIIGGTLISKFGGRRPLGFIVKISEATKEVAKGNFDVKMSENIPVTEFKEMTQNFNIMTQELAGTEMLRSDFIENVSHEFKTPLSAIEGYATLLQKKGLSEEKRIEYTKKILYNTKRLSSLTGNILLLSRLEHQEIEISREPYSLDEQLREVILLFEEKWGEKKIELDISLDPVDYFGNRDLLAQVWQNIFENAIKFVSNQGYISVMLRQTGSTVKVSITDNGIGMNSEVLGRIYEKFYQSDTSRAIAGNGLGLALAKRIIDLHNGGIEVMSAEGEGTTFIVTLPICD